MKKQRKKYRGHHDTLAVIATPPGEGGIGVIQVSGPDALAVVDKIFRARRCASIRDASSGSLFYGSVVDNRTSVLIDEAIVSIWRTEDSPTGEDLAEVNCHGGPRAVKNAFEVVIRAGAREAGRVEFMERGLENGRMDFIQLEAQEALIRAKTRLSVKVLTAQHQGLLSRSILRLENEVNSLTDKTSGRANSRRTHEAVPDAVSLLLNHIDELLASGTFGLALTSPLRVSIAGAPNVGKSTLFNTLLGEERAIVHHAPGTTRDYISEYFSIRGIPFELVDSAGLRETHDHVEREGVQRAHTLHKDVDRIILLLDGSRNTSGEERMLIGKFAADRIIPVINKIDLGVVLDAGRLALVYDRPVCRISALKGIGMESLEAALIREFIPYIERYETGRQPCPVVFTERQQTVLSQAQDAVREILEKYNHSRTLDIEAMDTAAIKLRECRYGPGCGGAEHRETHGKAIHNN